MNEKQYFEKILAIVDLEGLDYWLENYKPGRFTPHELEERHTDVWNKLVNLDRYLERKRKEHDIGHS